MYIETEVKFRISDKNSIIERLERAGFKKTGEVFERNIIFDNKRGELRKRNILLRLRIMENKNILTAKLPVHDKDFKVRKEIETAINNADEMMIILDAIGFKKIYIYEKKRINYDADEIKVSIDELPIGTFLEIEASKEDIKRTAELLKLDMKDAITKNYIEIYREYCRENSKPFGDLLFN